MKLKEHLQKDGLKLNEERKSLILENAKTTFSRTVENLEYAIRVKIEERDNSLDCFLNESNNTIKVKDFNSLNFTNKDIQLSWEIKNMKEELEIAKERYSALFED